MMTFIYLTTIICAMALLVVRSAANKSASNDIRALKASLDETLGLVEKVESAIEAERVIFPRQRDGRLIASAGLADASGARKKCSVWISSGSGAVSVLKGRYTDKAAVAYKLAIKEPGRESGVEWVLQDSLADHTFRRKPGASESKLTRDDAWSVHLEGRTVH